MTRARSMRLAALAGLVPVILIGINLAVRGLGIADRWWHVPLVMMLFWAGTALVAFLVLRCWAAFGPGGVSALARLQAGHPDWPHRDEFRVRYHPDTGLPEVDWQEGWHVAPRRCLVKEDAGTGELLFICVDPRPAGWMVDPGWWTWCWVMAAALALPLLAMLIRLQSYRYGDDTPPLMVFMGVMFFEMLGLMIYVLVLMARRRWRLVMGKPVEAGRIFSGPWLALEGFLMSDERMLYGKGERDKDGRELPTNRVLLAVFGLAAPRFEVSNYRWSAETMTELNRVLNLEFVAKRAEHVARFSARTGMSEAKTSVGTASDIPQQLD